MSASDSTPTLHRVLAHDRLYWLTLAVQPDELTVSADKPRAYQIGRWFRDGDPQRSRFHLWRGLHIVEWVPHELLDGTIWINPRQALIEVSPVQSPDSVNREIAWFCLRSQPASTP